MEIQDFENAHVMIEPRLAELNDDVRERFILGIKSLSSPTYSAVAKVVKTFLMINEYADLYDEIEEELKSSGITTHHAIFLDEFCNRLIYNLMPLNKLDFDRPIKGDYSVAHSIHRRHKEYLEYKDGARDSEESAFIGFDAGFDIKGGYDIKDEAYSICSAVCILVDCLHKQKKNAQQKRPLKYVLCKRCFRACRRNTTLCFEHNDRAQGVFKLKDNERLPIKLHVKENWYKFKPFFEEEIEILSDQFTLKGVEPTALSVERWLYTKRPHAYKYLITSKRTYVDRGVSMGAAVSWMLPVIDGLPYRWAEGKSKIDTTTIVTAAGVEKSYTLWGVASTVYSNFASETRKAAIGYKSYEAGNPIKHFTDRIDRMEAWFRAYERYKVKYKK